MTIAPHFAFGSAAYAGSYAQSHCRGDADLDLDRVVWDPEYRREVIELLAERDSVSGDAESPG